MYSVFNSRTTTRLERPEIWRNATSSSIDEDYTTPSGCDRECRELFTARIMDIIEELIQGYRILSSTQRDYETLTSRRSY
jgi:hypothetical protein